MTDIEKAKQNLDGHTICLCRDGECLYSDKHGIAPMMGFILDGVDLKCYSVADIVVGKAAALLFVKCGIKAVYAKTLSRLAEEVLIRHGIAYECETLVDRIINRDGTDICPMEKTVINIDDPDEAYAALKAKLVAMRA
ncbi:MAG: DUF1893 domain-containing protein [Clostridiales bacterium]|nr:DUF1893 domain-containing protein [Clostridiales bacterium]